jgi:hypothetical protein
MEGQPPMNLRRVRRMPETPRIPAGLSGAVPDGTDPRNLSPQARYALGLIPDPVRHEPTPLVVCLCGSTRFYDEFQQANYDLTMHGQIVLSVGFYPHAAAEHGHGEGVGHDSAEKLALDELHKRKIDLADYVLVLNVGGYIGQSTRSEIAYATARRKAVQYLCHGYGDDLEPGPPAVSPGHPNECLCPWCNDTCIRCGATSGYVGGLCGWCRRWQQP